jgi:hypothetical protein
MKLDDYLDNTTKQNNNINIKTLVDNYILFGYDDVELFEYELNILLKYVYKNKIISEKEHRPNQHNFRNNILQLYDNKCIISKYTKPLEAAHILEYCKYKDDNIYNGLLLTSSLHKLFDEYRWIINPKTKRVELNGEDSIDEIKLYENKYIDNLSNDTLLYLETRYKEFIKYKKIDISL